MTISELYSEWNSITLERKQLALQRLADYIIQSGDQELIQDMFLTALEFEDDDYFGTEGANV